MPTGFGSLSELREQRLRTLLTDRLGLFLIQALLSALQCRGEVGGELCVSLGSRYTQSD